MINTFFIQFLTRTYSVLALKAPRALSQIIGLVILIFLFIIGSILLLIVHSIGLTLGILAKKHSKEAAKIEPPNSAEKAGSVFAVFGIIINAILMGIDVIFTIVFLIIILT